jgi:DNA-binding NtrC family response regulator
MDDITDITRKLEILAADQNRQPSWAGTENILFVDDEPMILSAAMEYLEELGYTVKGAGTANDATQVLVEGFKPHLLCCDIVLPGGMNGVELSRKIHEIMPNVKILLASGYGAGSLDGSTNQDGFRMLSKPYTFEALGRRIRAILDGED